MSEKKADKKVDKKPGFMQRTKRYSKASINELKKVHWPNKKELITYTGVVLASVAVVSAMIWVVDSLIAALFSLLV